MAVVQNEDCSVILKFAQQNWDGGFGIGLSWIQIRARPFSRLTELDAAF